MARKTATPAAPSVEEAYSSLMTSLRLSEGDKANVNVLMRQINAYRASKRNDRSDFGDA